MTHRPIHSSSILLASVSRLSLAALLLVGGCDTQQQIERGQAEDTISFRSLTAPQYATRIYDMARSAKEAYKDGGWEPVEVRVPGDSVVSHPRVADYSTDVVQVFETDRGDQGISIIVSFRGTAFDLSQPGTAIGDLLRDLTGATTQNTANNPWTSDIDQVGKVGSGFLTRVTNYMESAGGRALSTRLSNLKDAERNVDIHVVGHSLGGITSQIFTYFCSQYLEEIEYPQDRFRLFNFAFNTPKGVNEAFHQDFLRRVNDGWFTPVNLTVGRDPVSQWTLNFSHSNIWSPNSDSDKIGPGGREYCPHGELPPRADVCGSLDNHWLDDERMIQWTDIDDDDGWPADIASCMEHGYDPIVLVPATAGG